MKKLFLTLAVIVASMSCNAQLLWKVSGNGVKGDSYLFGTHHVAPVDMLDKTPGFNDALKGVDAVYGEIDMALMVSPEAQQSILSLAMAPADSTLNKLYTTEQYDSINAVLKKYTGGMATLDQLNMLKPSMVATQIAMFQNMVAFPGFNASQQLDQTVQLKAKELGKAIKDFETVEFQMNLLFGDPIADQAEGLLKAARTDEEAIGHVKELARAYTEGDLAAIEKVMFAPEIGMDEETAKHMLYDRNDNWIKTIKDAVGHESIMVAVGIGHLVGERGLIKQLQDAGYTVTPVK